MNNNILDLNFRPDFPCPYLYDYLHTLWGALLNENQKVEKSSKLIKIIDIDFDYNIQNINNKTKKFPTIDLSEVEETYNSVIIIFNKCLSEIIEVLNNINGTNKKINLIKRFELFQRIVYPTKEIVQYINEITDIVKYLISNILKLIRVLYSLNLKPIEDIEHDIKLSYDTNGYMNSTMSDDNDSDNVVKSSLLHTGGGKTMQDVYAKVAKIRDRLNSLKNINTFDQSMIKKYSKFDNLDNLILLDFSLIKSIENDPKFNKKYFDNTNYYIWPIDNNYNLTNIHAYSICINGLELLFGKDEIKNSLPNKNKMNYYLKVLKNLNENVYELFLNGLTLKINTKNLLELINKLF